MTKKKGQVSLGSLLVIGAIGLLVASAAGIGPLATTGDQPDQPCEPPQNAGDTATLSLAAFDRTEDSSTQVASTLYKWKDNDQRIYLGSESGSASSRTTDSSYVVGCDVFAEAIAFDDTYEYAVAKEQRMLTTNELVNLDSWEAVSSSNVRIRFFDDTGSTTTSVSLSGDETYAFDKFDARVDTSNKAWDPQILMFDVPSGTNVSNIEVPNAERVDVPQSQAASYEYAFKIGDDSNKPSLLGFETTVQESIQITADSDGTSGETVTVGYLDRAPYITQDDYYAYGVEDDASSPSTTGVGVVTKDLTLN